MNKVLSTVAAAAVVIGVAAGCSSGGGGGGKGAPNSITGTVSGQTIKVTTGIFLNGNIGTEGQITYAILTDRADICSVVAGSSGTPGIPASSNLFIFNLGQNNGSSFSPATATGDYTVASGGPAPAMFIAGKLYQLDSTCHPTNSATMSSGTVKLTSTSPDVVGSGKNVSMDSGDVIGVNFDFASCPGLATFIQSTSGNAFCVP